MSKKFKGLFIGLAALVVLGGAVLLLVLLPNGSNEGDLSSSSSEATSSEETYTITDIAVDDITNLEIQNADGTYNIEKTTKDDSAVYSIKEMEGYPTITTNLSSVYTSAAAITSTRIVEEAATDLDQYGLKNPETKVSVTLKNGRKTVIYLGNEVAAVGGRYVSLEGEKTVYYVSSGYNYFLYSKDDYLDYTLTPYYSSISDQPRIDNMVFSGDNYGEEPVTIYPNDYSIENQTTHEATTYMLTTPITAEIDTTRGETYLGQLYNLTATSVYAYSPTEEQLAACGLDTPACEFYMEYTNADGNKQSVTLKVGNLVDGTYYIMKDGVDIIYTIAQDSVSTWVSLSWIDVVFRLVHYPNITSLSSVTIEYSGEKYTFDITSVTDAEGTATVQSVSVDGKEQKLDTFKKLYTLMISTSAEAYAGKLENPSGEKLLTITYNYADGSPDDVIEYITAETRMVYINFNGVSTYKMRQALADKIISQIPAYFAGETISTDW